MWMRNMMFCTDLVGSSSIVLFVDEQKRQSLTGVYTTIFFWIDLISILDLAFCLTFLNKEKKKEDNP